MSGILGAWALNAGTNQAVYINNQTDVAVVAVNICNQNNIPIEVRIALSSSATSPTNAEWLEYGAQVLGKGVLLRTGIAVTSGHYVVVQSNRPNVSAQVWGVETGEEVISPITITQNNVAPTITTSSSLPDITSGGFVEITIEST
jgi:hypothetical protein